MSRAVDALRAIGACDPAIDWVGERECETAWRECEQPGWLLWLLGELEADEVSLVRLACRFARDVLHLVQAGESQLASQLAIEAAGAWCDDPTPQRAREAAASAAAARATAEAVGATRVWAAAAARATAEAAEVAAAEAAAEVADAAGAVAGAALEALAWAWAAGEAPSPRAAAARRQCDQIREAFPWAEVARLARRAEVAIDGESRVNTRNKEEEK